MSPARTRPYLIVFVDGEAFAADAADVAEVFRMPAVTRLPGAPPSLLGLAGLRGAAAPVVSLARLLDRQETSGGQARLLLLSGEQSIGLAVDRVGALTDLPESDDRDQPTLHGRLYAVEGESLSPLDLDSLLRRAFTLDPGERRPNVEAAPVAAAPRTAPRTALLAFETAGQRYALPMTEVEEVLSAPSTLTPVAQSDAVALGVMEHRGRLLPVLSLRRLLGLEEGEAAEARIVVARLGGARIGLAVERLDAVLRVSEDAVDAAPAVLNRGDGETQVQAIARLPDGRGLVAVLAAERLFRDATVADILAEVQPVAQPVHAAVQDRHEAHLIFRVGDADYGLPLAAVDAVTPLPERLTRAPRAPAFVAGVLSLRSQVTPVIDLRTRFQAGAKKSALRPRILVTAVDGRRAGFIVDAVSEILNLDADRIEATPAMAAEAGRLFHRVATRQGGETLTLLVDPRELMAGAERDILAGLDAESWVRP